MKVEVIALKGFGTTKKGARVRLPRDQAQLLVKTKFAAYAPAEEAVPAKKVETRKPQTYVRRDMVAEKPEAPRAAHYNFPPKDDGKA